MPINNQSDFFLNFQQFGDIKRLAREGSDEASLTVARQFEGLFVQQMLSAMRAASRIDENQHSSYMDTYLDMYDKQLAQTISTQDRLGFSRMIMRQLPGADGAPPTAAGLGETEIERPVNKDFAVTVTKPAGNHPHEIETAAVAVVAKPEVESSAVLSKVVADDFAELAQLEQAGRRWSRPDQFIADIWPEAQAAALNLGVSPRLLVAQAALETGWGKHTMKFDDGRNSYNLFGIKADSDWQGDSLRKTSLEYGDGVLQPQVSRFRAYTSPAQSLADYVEFIQSSPRYRQALAQAGNDHAYIREIHNAGYATDPHYADKVIGIMGGELLQNSLAAIDTGVTDHA